MSMLQFFIAVDVTVVNVALPSIGADFGVDGHALTWVVVGYTVTGGGMLMVGGRLANLLGRRRVLLLGTGLFGAASLLAGLALTFDLLVVARLLQGAGEAIALPAAMATIVLMFPEGPRRSRALSVWAAVARCGLVLGFVLSGIITAHMGWRWIFLVSVPFIPSGASAGAEVAGRCGVLPTTPRRPAPHEFSYAATVGGLAVGKRYSGTPNLPRALHIFRCVGAH